MAENVIDLPGDESKEGKPGLGIMGLVKAMAVISVVVLVEVVAAAMLIPSAQDAESTARQLAAAEKGEMATTDARADDADAPTKGEDTVEVELGPYNVTRYDPESDTTLIVDFELFGVVSKDDAGDFATEFEANKVRVREQVIITMSGAESTDLSDAELGLIKRRILEKTNRALGKPLVREVLFSKFNFVER